MQQGTPRADRLHIALFGKSNSGKSSLINAITNQEVALVSHIAGTTTDPVYKPMEVFGVGPCIFIDTAGIDDKGLLGEMRVKQTYKIIDETDIAIIVCTGADIQQEKALAQLFKEKNTPVLWVLNKMDLVSLKEQTQLCREIEQLCNSVPLTVSTYTRQGIEEITLRIASLKTENESQTNILNDLVKEGETVMLVMPQDIQAPKGRLILPQVQTIRELLDKKCMVVSCTTDRIDQTLQNLSYPPSLIITDSQVFNLVYHKKPQESRLTSFSVLFAQYKGDIHYYISSAQKIAELTPQSKVLIAEACTHAPQTEDIGRIKIPNMLRKKIGNALRIDHVSGKNFPEVLSNYDLIIHCGGCMFNRKYVMSRIEQAQRQHIPMTNYGIAIAYLNNILDKICY